MGEGAICLKYSTLVLITVETSAMVLLLRFSRKQNIDSEDSYINSTAVFLSEFIKIFICIFVIAFKGNLKPSLIIIFIVIFLKRLICRSR